LCRCREDSIHTSIISAVCIKLLLKRSAATFSHYIYQDTFCYFHGINVIAIALQVEADVPNEAGCDPPGALIRSCIAQAAVPEFPGRRKAQPEPAVSNEVDSAPTTIASPAFAGRMFPGLGIDDDPVLATVAISKDKTPL
jgi:hypothetical protein